MNQLPLRLCLFLLSTFLIVACSDSGEKLPETSAAKQLLSEAELGGYSPGVALENIRLLWRLREDSIDIKLAAKTKGWVGVGFNPETGENMKGANLIIGYVKAGKLEIVDHYGTMKDKHKEDEKIGGRADLSNLSGSEIDGTTELEFTLPLNSGDAMDKPLDTEGDNIVLLAYGRSDSLVLKHRFRALLRLNLATGENSVVRMK